MNKLSSTAINIGLFGKRILKSNLNYAIFMFSVIGIMAGLWSLLGGIWSICFAAMVMVFFALIFYVRKS
jgi:hypothetical protein